VQVYSKIKTESKMQKNEVAGEILRLAFLFFFRKTSESACLFFKLLAYCFVRENKHSQQNRR